MFGEFKLLTSKEEGYMGYLMDIAIKNILNMYKDNIDDVVTIELGLIKFKMFPEIITRVLNFDYDEERVALKSKVSKDVSRSILELYFISIFD